MPLWLKAIYAIWIVWAAAWALAWLWANRTAGTATRAAQAPYRTINLIGWVALFSDGAMRRAAGGFRPAIALAGALIMVCGYVLKARVEERFLAAELDAGDYAAYRRRVPMLVPFAPPSA